MKALIFTATYNEADNIESLIQEIKQYLPNQTILVVDDASPDGTGRILDRLAEESEWVHVIHRPKKLGLGSAHKLAMKYALLHEFDVLVTMDADFSHHPKYLPRLISELDHHDFVTGSRYAPGAVLGYGFIRSLISRTANILARCLLGLPLKECTTSFRGFQRALLQRFPIDTIQSEGYSFFVESIFYISSLTNKVTEFPLYFEDRRAGTSKISKAEIGKGVLNLLRLFYLRVSSPFSNRLDEAMSSNSAQKCSSCGSPYQRTVPPSQIKKFPERTDIRLSLGQPTLQCLQCGTIHGGEFATGHPSTLKQS